MRSFPRIEARNCVGACGLLLAVACGQERTKQGESVTDLRVELAASPGATTTPPAETGVVHEHELVAAPTELLLLDGRSLSVWAYNGQVPGPVLRAPLGDRLRIRVVNRLPQPTSVHWHGVRLENAMDGVPGVTQPPIAPGESFTYEIFARDAGTFWFHPHIRGSEQVERGLHGMLIVEDPRDPRVRELTWFVDDWRLDRSGAIEPAFVTLRDLAHDGRWGNIVTVNGRAAFRERIGPGERIRMRLVNVANGRVFAPRVVGAEARVIAFDGRPTSEPLPLEGLVLAPGNRVDLEVVAPMQSGADIRVFDVFGRRRRTLARLSVRGDTAPSDPRPFATTRSPDWSRASELDPDLVYALSARRGGPHGIEWTLNGEAMRMEHHGADATHDTLEMGRFVKMRFVNESARLHPMHLHGQFFRVLARNGSPVDEGHWRDTVLVGPRETVEIGLVPEDAGRWALHCHILEHHDSGMMTVVRVLDGA